MRTPRTFAAVDADRGKGVPLLIGIMSPSGGGKTFSALRLATGIQQVYGGDIYGLDTENDRMLHYADQFKFKHVPFKPPFGSLDYLDAMKWCSAQGARVTIVDSMSHEHIGEGGYLATAEAKVDRIAGNDWKKREACQFLGWAEAGPKRQQMIEGIKQLPGVFIFCYRAKEKTKPIKKEGKTEAVQMGFMPIAGEEWVYEMAMNCMLEPRSEGVPTWRSDQVGERLMMKLPRQFRHLFPDHNTPLSEDIGRAMALWAKGGEATLTRTNPKPSPPDQPASRPASSDQAPQDDAGQALLQEARDAADRGKAVFQAFYKRLTPPQADLLDTISADLKQRIADADSAPAEPESDHVG